MLTFRIAKFTAAIVVTGLLTISILAITLDTYLVDEAGRRASMTRHLRHEAAPAWPELAKAYKRTIPPKDIEVPSGNPFPTLERLNRIPYSRQVFYASPDRRLIVSGALAGARYNPKDFRLEIDLDTWKPELLDRTGIRTRWSSRGLSKAQRKQLVNEMILRDIKDVLADNWEWQELRESWRQYPVLASEMKDPTYLKGDAKVGFIGVVSSLTQLQRDDGDAILDRLGIAHKFGWSTCCWGNTNAEFRPPGGFGFLEPMRLRVNDAYQASLMPDLELRYWAILGALLSAMVLSVSASIRQLKALLSEVALAHSQSNFVSGISHEMRIPLTTVKMYADMLAQGVITDPEMRSAYLKTMSQEADRLSRLIENVLDYSRISNKRRIYRFERLQVYDLVRDALSAVEGPLTKAGMTVETDVPPNLGLDGDRDALVQSLVNLLSNAIKYAPDTWIGVTATERPDCLVISVQDHGPGIPEREQARIFRPFYRVGDELTRAAPGSGLGLTLVKEYVWAHGGRVELHSRPGEGSRFDLLLPKIGGLKPAKQGWRLLPWA